MYSHFSQLKAYSCWAQKQSTIKKTQTIFLKHKYSSTSISADKFRGTAEHSKGKSLNLDMKFQVNISNHCGGLERKAHDRFLPYFGLAGLLVNTALISCSNRSRLFISSRENCRYFWHLLSLYNTLYTYNALYNYHSRTWLGKWSFTIFGMELLWLFLGK